MNLSSKYHYVHVCSIQDTGYITYYMVSCDLKTPVITLFLVIIVTRCFQIYSMRKFSNKENTTKPLVEMYSYAKSFSLSYSLLSRTEVTVNIFFLSKIKTWQLGTLTYKVIHECYIIHIINSEYNFKSIGLYLHLN